MAFRRDWPVWSARASTPTVEAGSVDPYDDRVRLFDHGPTVGDPSSIQNYWLSPDQDNSVRLWPVRKNPLREMGTGMDFSPVGCLARRPSNRLWVNGPVLESFDSWSLGKITPAQAFADTTNDHNVWNDGWRRWVRIGVNTLVTYNHFALAPNNQRSTWLANPANQAGGVYNTLFFMGRDDQVHQIEIEPDLDLMDQIVTDTGFNAWYYDGLFLNGNSASDLIFAKFSETPPDADVISIAYPVEWIQQSTQPKTVIPMPVSGYAVGNQNRIARFQTNGMNQGSLSCRIDDNDFPFYIEPLVIFNSDSGTPLLAPASRGRVAYVGLASSKDAFAVNTYLDNVNISIVNTALANLGRSSEAIETILWSELYEETPAAITGPIRPKRTEVAGREPLANQIEVGEIAVNLEDRKIFSKKSDGTVVAIADGIGSVVQDSYLILIETPIVKTYTLDARVAAARTVTNFYAKTSTGSCIAVLKNLTDATTIGTIAVTDSGGSAASLTNTALGENDRIAIEITANSSSADLEMVVEYTQ
jgi:hypothetical protein